MMVKLPGLYAPDGSTYITITDGGGTIVTQATTPVDAGAVQTLSAGQQAQARSNIGGTGNLIAVTTFTSSGTWTKSANGKAVFVEVHGAGGGGGGVSSTVGYLTGAGGGEGGTALKYVSVPGATETVTIGAAGTAGTTAGTNGGTGGTTSFGTWAVASGGTGGFGSTSSNLTGVGGNPGVGTTGDVNIRGIPGGRNFANSTATEAISGMGGGRGGGNSATGSAVGVAGTNGGGGSGGSSATFATNAAAAGGLGGAGYVIVWEYA